MIVTLKVNSLVPAISHDLASAIDELVGGVVSQGADALILKN